MSAGEFSSRKSSIMAEGADPFLDRSDVVISMCGECVDNQKDF